MYKEQSKVENGEIKTREYIIFLDDSVFRGGTPEIQGDMMYMM